MVFTICFFFFQAEDGIRDWSVTGVQTCALPIFQVLARARSARKRSAVRQTERNASWTASCASASSRRTRSAKPYATPPKRRSEERRVGKECRSRWEPYRTDKKK